MFTKTVAFLSIWQGDYSTKYTNYMGVAYISSVQLLQNNDLLNYVHHKQEMLCVRTTVILCVGLLPVKKEKNTATRDHRISSSL